MWGLNKRDGELPSTAVEQPLWQLVYVSAAKPGLSNDAIDLILHSARRRNAALEVTGMLMLVDDSFCQILEGSREHLETLLDRIILDHRHSHVRLLQMKTVSARSFPDWSMGPPSRTLREFSDAPDVERFFQGIHPTFTLASDDTRKVLTLFHSGAFAQHNDHHGPAHHA